MKTEKIVGVDIGGTSMKAASIINKEVVKVSNVATEGHRSAEEILETLFKLIEEVILPDTLAIGIGVPGLINVNEGQIINISNIPAWKGLNLREKVEERFNVSVYINNDANCFALGEKHFGKGAKYKDFIAIAFGTGVGSGIIINHKIHSGMFGAAGEIGCWPYEGQTFEEFCGSRYFSERKGISGEEMYAKAVSGDFAANRGFKELGHHIGKLISNCLYILAPEAIIIGGSISKSFDLFKSGLQAELDNFPFDIIKDNITIEKSELDHIAILGAAGLYYDSIKN